MTDDVREGRRSLITALGDGIGLGAEDANRFLAALDRHPALVNELEMWVRVCRLQRAGIMLAELHRRFVDAGDIDDTWLDTAITVAFAWELHNDEEAVAALTSEAFEYLEPEERTALLDAIARDPELEQALSKLPRVLVPEYHADSLIFLVDRLAGGDAITADDVGPAFLEALESCRRELVLLNLRHTHPAFARALDEQLADVELPDPGPSS